MSYTTADAINTLTNLFEEGIISPEYDKGAWCIKWDNSNSRIYFVKSHCGITEWMYLEDAFAEWLEAGGARKIKILKGLPTELQNAILEWQQYSKE